MIRKYFWFVCLFTLLQGKTLVFFLTFQCHLRSGQISFKRFKKKILSMRCAVQQTANTGFHVFILHKNMFLKQPLLLTTESTLFFILVTYQCQHCGTKNWFFYLSTKPINFFSAMKSFQIAAKAVRQPKTLRNPSKHLHISGDFNYSLKAPTETKIFIDPLKLSFGTTQSQVCESIDFST